MNLITPLKKRQKSINKQIKKIEHALTKLPQGQIVCYSNGKYSKWYLKKENGLKWIPKKNRDLAIKLAYKKYLLAQIDDLKEERLILDTLSQNDISKKSNQDLSQTEILLNNPLYSALLAEYLASQNNKWAAWMKEAYPTNLKHPEQKIHPTLSGIYVRSKSEETIERLLSTNHIPFRYEPAVEFDSIVVYPDFLIIHPKTEEVFIWEHFGIMDNPDYVHKTLKKIELYNNAGYRPEEKLIMTFESKTNPFTYQKAEEIVWKYFLN